MPRVANNTELHLQSILLPPYSKSSATTTRMLFLPVLLLLDGIRKKDRVCIISHLEVDYSVNLGQLVVCIPYSA